MQGHGRRKLSDAKTKDVILTVLCIDSSNFSVNMTSFVEDANAGGG